MLSQNIAKSTVPSANHFRFNYPQPAYMNQWRGVYYFAGISKMGARSILLGRKRFLATENARFAAATSKLRADAESVLPQVTSASLKGLEGAKKFELVSKATMLHSYGLFEEGQRLYDTLHAARVLNCNDYANVLRSLAAPALMRTIVATDASFDETLALKLLADRRGSDRFTEAHRVFDDCGAIFPLESQGTCGGLGIRHVNELMGTALTCGFDALRSVSGVMYDQLETLRIAPTVDTYRHVFTSLGLEGKVGEANAILRFLEAHHSAQLSLEFYNAAMAVYRDNKLYDECDALWERLIDARNPSPDARTAEIYLRSVIDRSYLRSAETMGKWGELGIVEKKRVPQILQQMERVGIPRAHLSPPLSHEIEDALRKFSIHKSRFYEWGRATKLFTYIEQRRKYGWLYDIKEMNLTRAHAPLYRNPDQMGKAIAPSAAAELPSWYAEKDSWLVSPMESVLNRVDVGERFDGARNGDVFYSKKESIHERSPTWMLDSPQTRYDQLYGLNNPDIPKIGIRRHLGPEYRSADEQARRDASVLKNALSSGRRLRKKVERERTHRNAAE